MSAILEAATSHAMPESSNVGTNPQLSRVRQFALDQIGARLSSDATLAGEFWAQIGESEDHPDITVLYCAVRCVDRTFALEEFVKSADPTSCDREIPLFCRILDAFEGSAKDAGKAVAAPDLELLDFGI